MVLKKLFKTGMDLVVETTENVLKDVFNNQDIDIYGAVSGALIEVGLGKVLPDGEFFGRQANKYEKKIDRNERLIGRKNWEQKSDRYKRKVERRLNAARSEFKTLDGMSKALSRTAASTAEGASNVIELPTITVKSDKQ